MKPFRVLVPLAGAAASALLLTACGSSGGGGGGSSSSPTSSSSSSATPPAPATSTADSSASTPASGGSPATKAQLQKIVLQPSDLPGYKATAPDPDSGDETMDKQLAACTGQPGAPASHKVNSAQSQDFQLGEVTVSSDFSSYRSAGDIGADVAQLKSPKINDCLNSAFKSVLAKSAGAGSTVTDAQIKLTPGSGGGPSNVVALAAGIVNLTVNGQKAAVYLGIAFVTGPQLDGTLTFIGINKQLDAATQMSALAAVAKRAQNP